MRCKFNYKDLPFIRKAAENIREIDPESIIALSLVLLKQLQPFIQDLTNLR